ncbi:MAG: peptidoglycan editing factor PgeF [Chloroflexota bacterium]|nr:peptidoglycan editing factor PgeF [Chloroflexota bacterium]
MPFNQVDSLRYYTFDIFDQIALTHAVFTRHGGYSPEPWDSLNMGSVVGDDIQRVNANRERAFRSVGRDPASMYDVWQMHTAKVVCTDAPRPAHIPHIKADAILTDSPDVTLFMRFADCVPILLHDPIRRVVGLVHAGWQGTVWNVVAAALETMTQRYSSQPAHIRAGIGPSIGLHHYEVGDEVVAQVRQLFDNDDVADDLLPKQNGVVKFDLWNANRLLLADAGVSDIQIAGLCTACHLDDWYSHRAENGKTGRFGALIGLNAHK